MATPRVPGLTWRAQGNSQIQHGLFSILLCTFSMRFLNILHLHPHRWAGDLKISHNPGPPFFKEEDVHAFQVYHFRYGMSTNVEPSMIHTSQGFVSCGVHGHVPSSVPQDVTWWWDQPYHACTWTHTETIVKLSLFEHLERVPKEYFIVGLTTQLEGFPLGGDGDRFHAGGSRWIW